MPDNGSAQANSIWPLPKFYFRVIMDGQEMSFQEVSGLNAETQVIEYRDSNSPTFSTIKMPGIAKFGNVTMKKGVFKSDKRFRDWYNTIKMNTIKRVTVVIQLLDETGAPTITWTLQNAWPTKITGTDLKSNSNELAIETIELVHEGLTITNHMQ
jgi:phage tail-like protein